MPTPFANDRRTNVAIVVLALIGCAGIITTACFWLAKVAQRTWECWPWH